MKFCPECGAQLADDVAFCTECGAAFISEVANKPEFSEPVIQTAQVPAYTQQPPPAAPVYDPYPVNVTHKGFWWLGFVLPPAGLVFFIVWKRSRPRLSRSAGKGALTGAIFETVLSTAIYILGVVLAVVFPEMM